MFGLGRFVGWDKEVRRRPTIARKAIPARSHFDCPANRWWVYIAIAICPALRHCRINRERLSMNSLLAGSHDSANYRTIAGTCPSLPHCLHDQLANTYVVDIS